MIEIGVISNRVANLLNITNKTNTPIYIGKDNITHMIKNHLNDYNTYGQNLKQIIEFPDYVAWNSKDNSIEYIKEFNINNEFVKVAVRATCNDIFFVRTLYVVKNSRVANFIKKGTLQKV